jgi:RecB family exonuclease
MVSRIRVSHSSIIDFNKCSRLYYFKSLYRNPKTGNRVQLVSPYLSLGSVVHETIDKAVNLSLDKRKNFSLGKNYDKIWKKYSGKKGGFVSEKQEKEFKKRGFLMLKKVQRSSLFNKKTLKKEEGLPSKALSENIDLAGRFDWIEVLGNNNLHIVDFKTGRSQEKKDSWQLPIYQILAQEIYQRKVDRLSYWYLDKSRGLTKVEKVNPEKFLSQVKEKALEIEKAIKEKNFSCSSNYHKCYWCRPYEKIVSGAAEYVAVDEKMEKDLFFLTNGNDVLRKIKESDFLSQEEKDILETRLNDQEELKKSPKDIEKIKKKIKKNLSRRELVFFIEELKKNGQRRTIKKD